MVRNYTMQEEAGTVPPTQYDQVNHIYKEVTDSGQDKGGMKELQYLALRSLTSQLE